MAEFAKVMVVMKVKLNCGGLWLIGKIVNVLNVVVVITSILNSGRLWLIVKVVVVMKIMLMFVRF